MYCLIKNYSTNYEAVSPIWQECLFLSPFKEGRRETGKMFSNKSLGLGFPGGASGKEPACQCRRHKRHRFDPWVGKTPWRRRWQPTPVILPGESHGQRSLGATVHGVPKSSLCVNCFWDSVLHIRKDSVNIGQVME